MRAMVRNIRATRQPAGKLTPLLEISALVAVKVLLLVALSQLFFSPSRHPRPTPDAVAEHLFSSGR